MRVEVASYGAPALEALRDIVASAKGDEPMATVTVVVPNNVAGIVARRHLAKGLQPGHSGVAAIDVTTLPRLAERLAASRLAPRRPATRTLVAASWRRRLEDDPGQFAVVADHPATVRALVQAHEELRDLSRPALEAVASQGGLSPDLVRINRQVTSDLSTGWYDEVQLLDEACQADVDLGTVVLYLPQALTQAEVRLATHLAGVTDFTIVVALTGAKRADRAVNRTLDRLGVAAGAGPSPGVASRVINASDSDDEVRYVVRDVVETLKSTPAHRVAVLYAARSPYSRLLHEQLAAAGVTVNGTGTRAANDRATARTLLEVLALVDRDVPRADLFRALANAPTHDFEGNRIPVARWERTSRNAGVVNGQDWSHRIDTYVASEHAAIADERSGEEPRQWLIDRAERQIETAITMSGFVTQLRSQLSQAKTLDSWNTLSSWALSLFHTLVGDGDALLKLPREEQYAAARVTTILQSLAGIEDVDATPSLGTLRDVLDLELSSSVDRVGRFGDGVLVAPISQSIGLDLDVVFIVGLAEDLYPGRLREDALLPQVVRAATGDELPSHDDRLHAKYRHLLAALSCAELVIASFPRGDLRRSSRRLPSRWLLPTLRALAADNSLAATKWDEPDYGEHLATAGSYAGELLETTRLSTEQEWRVRQTTAAGFLDDPSVLGSVEMIQSRDGAKFTRYDGNLSDVDGLPDYSAGIKSVSPTALESYASCPHAFFVSRLLGVQPLEQPEDIIEIPPMEIGNLVHNSMERFIKSLGDDLPGFGESWSADQRAALMVIAEQTATEFERRGLTGHPRLWARDRHRILTDMIWLLDDDDEWRASVDARVVASEMPFGLDGAPPLKIVVPGGHVLMRGSADKIDIARDGTIFVTDIKTGSRRAFKDITQEEPLVAGTKLQLPVYAHAAREQYGDRATDVHASYWFVRRDRGRIGIDLEPDLETKYADTLGILVRSIAAGLFPPKAPEQDDFIWVQCAYCNPDGIGHAENHDRWHRKRNDPALAELTGLIDPSGLESKEPS